MNCLLVTGGYDNTLRLWRADNGACTRTLQHADSQVNCLDITADRQIIAAGGHSQIRFYEPKSASVTPSNTFEGHTNNVTTVGFSQDGKLMFSGSEDETVKIWDVRGSNEHTQEFNHNSPVTCACLHPNQTELLAGDQNGSLTRWDLKTSKCAEILIPMPGVAVRSVCVSPDGQYTAAINNEGCCFVWRMHGAEMEAFRQLPAHPRAFGLKCKFSPDGSKLITTSSDKTAHIYDAKGDFRLLQELAGHGAWVWDAAFSADSRFVATACSDKIGRLWDVSQGRLALELKGHQRAITCIALNDSVF